MALIYCTECGERISDKASACPHCGCPCVTHEINLKEFHINILWKGRKGDSIRKTLICVDGAEVGVLRCGDRISIPVKFGEHLVEFWQGNRCLLWDNVIVSFEQPEHYIAFKESIGLSHPVLKLVNNIDAVDKFTADTVMRNQPKTVKRNADFAYPPKSRGLAFVLCLFLGGLGFHRFYVGKIGTGLLWMCTLGLFGIGVILDFFSILFGLFTDKYGQRLI